MKSISERILDVITKAPAIPVNEEVEGVDNAVVESEIEVPEKTVVAVSLAEEIAMILSSKIQSVDVEEIKEASDKSIVTDEWMKKIKKMVDQNYHTEVVVEKAKLLGYTKYGKVLDLVMKIQAIEGYSPDGIANYVRYISKELDDYAKMHLSKSDYESLRRV
jgi:ATP phosphoribosyltransferase regulatory subunit HisZ